MVQVGYAMGVLFIILGIFLLLTQLKTIFRLSFLFLAIYLLVVGGKATNSTGLYVKIKNFLTECVRDMSI
jgi:hypothetical protein